MVKFEINNKTHSTTKISLFMENYRRELRIEIDIKRKEKIKKATEFVKKIKKIQEEARAVLKKTQEEIK